MAIIKNIHLIENETIANDLDKTALNYQRFARIKLKIISIEQTKITVQVLQEKRTDGGSYADKSKLIEIGKDTFSPYYENVNVQAIIYQNSPIQIVTGNWIQNQMKVHNLKGKDILFLTDIDRPELSSIISGLRPLSNRSKALFYYLFRTLDLEKTK